jgi:oligopeptide/dipeptide ABC transporter ATP-binding protein
MTDAAAPLLEVRDLHTYFPTHRGVVKAVEGVSFELRAGEILGIVGESGCGKSITALSIARLLPPPGRIVEGSIRFDGQELTELSEPALQKLRGDRIGMIFQDPMTSLNPVYRVGWQVAEPFRLHRGASRARAAREAQTMLTHVGIPQAAERARDYPHQFSGGMRQRALIASSLGTSPTLLLADEPTTALDVTVQAQILELIRSITEEYETATMLITHNLGVVSGLCDRVIVMYAGKVVEAGTTEDVLVHPRHPYTWGLLQSLPQLDRPGKYSLRAIEGTPPDPASKPSGCAFHPRCSFRLPRCATDVPVLAPMPGAGAAACWHTQAGGRLE